MKYISTRNQAEIVSFEEAVVKGLAQNKGLFVPQHIPLLPVDFFNNMNTRSNEDIACELLSFFTKESIDAVSLEAIVAQTLSFPTPIVPIKDNIYALELFHGPTQAFKDVGARFMSRCLAHFVKNKKVTILVATSGDTGSAVANGFFEVEGVEVVILFPKGKVSPYQEYQMTSLGKNIQVLEVEGTFDDCQSLVKQAFDDENLNSQRNLSSANSINIARLLPQMLYYFFAYKDLLSTQPKELLFSVPSGNLGNLTAGILAKKMGLPANFLAAMNTNDTFDLYLKSGNYSPKSSVFTYSNAMDVGAPSNFERLEYLYKGQWELMQAEIQSLSVDNVTTVQQMQQVYEQNNYILDPHGAVGMYCLEQKLKEGQTGIFLETAHPKKFEQIVRKAIPSFPNAVVDLGGCQKTTIRKNYEDLRDFLAD